MIENNKQYFAQLDTMESDEQARLDKAQENIEYFVQNYNGNLTFNKSGFTRLMKLLHNDAKTMLKFLKQYTNITFVSNDFKDFKTDLKSIKTTKEKEKITVYHLKFNENWTGQKWYENIEQDAEETIKQLTNKGLKAKLKNLLTTLQGNSKTENKVSINTSELETICENYIARLEQAESVA